MLLPALNKARAKGKSVSCVNKLKQQSTAFAFYLGDYEDFLPSRSNAAWKELFFNRLIGIPNTVGGSKYADTGNQGTYLPVSALPKTGYRINWILDDSGRIRCRVFIDAKAVEAYQLKEPGAAYENLKGNLCQEFRLSGSNTSVRVYQKGNTKTVQLKGTSDTELFRSSELPEKLIFYGEDGKENFRIVDLAITPNGSLVISRQKGVPCLRISLLKANGRKIEQKAEFSCDFILQ